MEEQSNTISRNDEQTIVEEEYDEQSEVQARVWNQFVRKKNINGNLTGAILVTSESIKSATNSSF